MNVVAIGIVGKTGKYVQTTMVSMVYRMAGMVKLGLAARMVFAIHTLKNNQMPETTLAEELYSAAAALWV